VTSPIETLPGLAQRLAPQMGEPVWIQVGTLFDGEQVWRDAHVVYDHCRIRWLGTRSPDADEVRPQQRAPDVVLPDHLVLPGLVEAHAHFFLEGGEENPARRAEYLQQGDETLRAKAQRRLERLLRLGVTAVRDAGDANRVGLGLAARYRSPDRGLMPLVESPGAALHHQGRYGAFMGRPIEAYDSIETAVAARIADGAQHLKLLATGIINFEKGAVTAKPQMGPEELTRAVQAAHAHGRQVMVHCSGADGVENCLAARVDTIEHGFFITDEQLARLRDLDVAWVPTFAPVQYQLDHATELGWSETVQGHLRRILDEHAARLRRANELGVRVIAGSDAGSHGVPHGHGLQWELELMAAAGLSPRAVLHSATGAAARLQLTEPVGALRTGSPARFILTPAPVLEDIRQLRVAPWVVFDGTVLTGGDDPREPGL
jgi:imidazolonepropionase-like amidohydrolase